MLRLTGVRRSFRGARVLDGIDLTLRRGETLGVIGPAAAGKSVLLKVACGLYRPDGGTVELEGEELTSAAEARLQALRSRIGMLFQNNALFDFMTVGDNVAFPLVRRGELPGDEIARRVGERLRAVGLAGTEDKHPGELSGGMRKRVGIARAMVDEPALVLYDEPTAGLDPVTTSKIYELLTRERDRTGATVVVVSSDVEALLRFAPRLAMLHRGRLVYDGPAAAVEQAADPAVRQFVRGDDRGPL